jgi:serine/threonine-protein kinase
MSDVFVSYKAEDRRRVQQLVNALEADGLSVWWDTHIGGAAAWRETIEHELNAAKCVIVVWSAHSIGPGGSFVRDEASRAWERGTYLPVKIDDSRPPLGFGETQALPLFGWKGKRADSRYQAVLTTARAIIEGGPRPIIATPSATPGVSRRALIAGGGVAAAAAAGLGGWLFVSSRRVTSSESIAVLPFENLSGDPKQAYFSDGIAEELRDDLSRIAGLRVVARASSEAVRNDVVTVAAKKLNVGSILTGSVRRSPELIRVSAQLIDGKDGLEHWSRTYDRPAGEGLAIQTEIAQRVAGALSFRLGSSAELALGGTRDPQAQDLLFKAIDEERHGNDTPESLRRVIGLLDAAIAIDPNYAKAHAQKAYFVISSDGVWGEEAMHHSPAEGLASARRAVAIAPRFALGHLALGVYYGTRLRFGAALKEYRMAATLPGSSVDSLEGYSAMLLSLGRFEESDAIFEKAIELNPLDPELPEAQVQRLFYESRFKEAANAAAAGLRSSPDAQRIRLFLGYTQIALGQTHAAKELFQTFDPSDWHRLDGLTLAAARSGDRSEALNLLSEMQRQFPGGYYQYAQIHAQLGDRDAAFADLGKAVENFDTGLPLTKIDPLLQPLHGDPRFASLIVKLGLA